MPENKSKWTDEIVYSALKEAVRKVDFEVTKIRKWDRQGSTVAAVYINESHREKGNESLSEGTNETDLNSEDELENDDDNEEEKVLKGEHWDEQLLNINCQCRRLPCSLSEEQEGH